MKTNVSKSITVLIATLLAVFAYVLPAQATTISAGYPVSLLARKDSTSQLYSYGGGTTGYLANGRVVGRGWNGFNYGIQIASLQGK